MQSVVPSHCSLEPHTGTYPNPIEFHPHPVSIKSVSVLFSYLFLDLQSDVFPSVGEVCKL